MDKEIDFKKVFQRLPMVAVLLLPDMPDFTIVEITDSLTNNSPYNRDKQIGRSLFELYPDNPDDKNANGERNLRGSLQKVLDLGISNKMEVQRYDVLDSDGNFQENYWEAENTPLMNSNGTITYILHTSINVTERILNQRLAKSSNDNFNYFLDQALAPFAIITGKEHIFTFVNRAYKILMNGRELIGKSIEEAIPELKGQEFLTIINKVFETGTPFHASEIPATAIFENSTTPTTKYFNLSYTPYKNPKGEIEGILASGFDVTEKVELRNKQQKIILNLQAYNLFMQVPVGFFLVRGPGHTVQLANNAALVLTGRPENIVGKNIREIFPEIEQQGQLQLLEKVKNEGQSVILKETPVVILKNGVREDLFLNLVYQPYYEGEDIIGVLAILTDVTEQVLARKKLEHAEQKARIAIESAELGVYEVDMINNTIDADAHFFKLFGFDQPAPWNNLTSLIPEEDLLIREKAYEEALLTGKLFYITRLQLPKKNIRWLKINGTIFFNENHDPVKLLGVVEDITKQKFLDQQKDAFLSMASHELKTPVTTMKAYGQIAETILEEKGDIQTLGMIRKMGAQVNKLTRIINDLLDVTKIHQDKYVVEDEVFSFKELIDEVIDDMAKITTTHRIETVIESSGEVKGDRNKINQVLNNLISNAIKYSPNGKVVKVHSRVVNNNLEFSVQDFGIGIAEEFQANVFEQFFRVTGENQSTFPGMGIGLYISCEIIKRHHGKIWVKSELGKGSIFFISLPLA